MTPQTVTIEIAPQTAALLQERAQEQGLSLDELLLLVLKAPDAKEEKLDSVIDWDYAAKCAAEAAPSITLEEVRGALSKIPGSMIEDFRKERDDR